MQSATNQNPTVVNVIKVWPHSSAAVSHDLSNYHPSIKFACESDKFLFFKSCD